MLTEQTISNFEKLNALEKQSLREKIKNMPRPEIHRIMKSLAEGVTKKGGKIFFQLPLKNSETIAKTDTRDSSQPPLHPLHQSPLLLPLR